MLERPAVAKEALLNLTQVSAKGRALDKEIDEAITRLQNAIGASVEIDDEGKVVVILSVDEVVRLNARILAIEAEKEQILAELKRVQRVSHELLGRHV